VEVPGCVGGPDGLGVSVAVGGLGRRSSDAAVVGLGGGQGISGDHLRDGAAISGDWERAILPLFDDWFASFVVWRVGGLGRLNESGRFSVVLGLERRVGGLPRGRFVGWVEELANVSRRVGGLPRGRFVGWVEELANVSGSVAATGTRPPLMVCFRGGCFRCPAESAAGLGLPRTFGCLSATENNKLHVLTNVVL